MTNEEKAKLLAGYEINTPRNLMSLESRDEYDRLIEMVKWKDQQFKEYLEKKREESEKCVKQQFWYGDDAYDVLENKERIKFVNEIISELFKED